MRLCARMLWHGQAPRGMYHDWWRQRDGSQAFFQSGQAYFTIDTESKVRSQRLLESLPRPFVESDGSLTLAEMKSSKTDRHFERFSCFVDNAQDASNEERWSVYYVRN